MYNRTDPIASISIIMINPESTTKEETVVTDYFKINKGFTLQEYLKDLKEDDKSYRTEDNLIFELEKYDDILNSAIFKVNLSLESGKVLTAKTVKISFTS